MRSRPLGLLLALALFECASARAPLQEIENAAAFARLYGVVRYFYPSDAAASLDWDAFAVHGLEQVRTASDTAALDAALESLFSPLGPGIEIGPTLPAPPQTGKPDESLIAWRYMGPGISPGSMGPYRGKRTNRPLVVTTAIDGFASLMQTVPAESLRGKTVRLRGRARAVPQDSIAGAALWLRVDRPESKMGFFDNMGNRPIRKAEWDEYSIEGPVADDATSVAMGVMASGAVTADFDAIELSVKDARGGWNQVPLKDEGFEAAASTAEWSRVGTSRNAQITRVSENAPQGGQFVRLSPPSVPPVTAELMDDVPPIAGAHVDVDLGSGLRARVPLSLPDADATADPKGSPRLAALRAALKSAPEPLAKQGINTRLADVVVAWNVFRHFYPYWTEADVDWDARLRPLLELAATAKTRELHLNALRQLVADVRDGHGNVIETAQPRARAVLPLRLAIVEEQLVVTASGSPTDVPVGAVISTIDGVPALKRIADAMALASGTAQWKQTRALQEVTACERGSIVNLSVNSGGESQAVSLRCDTAQVPAERRPEPITEVSAGIWYVDLSRATVATIMPRIETLAKATGVIFDLRGYPTDAGARILPYLVDAPEGDRWMHIAKIVGPFHQVAGWQSVGWNVGPLSPRLTGRIVFLTDGRAISYAESVMGYIKDRKLGTIVGAPTAGANGNVVRFQVPGAFAVTFTGMRVTGHDGQAPHHLRGVQPDIPASPTLAGIRSNRDEVLERGVAVIKEAASSQRN
jgi:hypothetical protein